MSCVCLPLRVEPPGRVAAVAVALFALAAVSAAVVKITSKQSQIHPVGAHEEDDYNNDNSTDIPEGENMTIIRVGTWNVLLMYDEYHRG